MKLNKFCLIIFIISLIFLTSAVSAYEVNDTDVQTIDGDYANLELNDTEHQVSLDNSIVYVDNDNGDDSNDGKSQQSSVKSFDKAMTIAKNNYSIYLADGEYAGLKNTRITIDKSVNVIGSNNTVFDGQNSNFIFTIQDNVSVCFKNIKFINAFKQPTYNNPTSMYGSALDIKNANVLIDGCSFINNHVVYESAINKYNYGGAISNFGDLTITNSYFTNNHVASTSGLYGYGGTIYNKGNLLINSSIFDNSTSNIYSYGGVIYNDGNLVVDKSIFSNSFSSQQSKGSVLYNNGNCTLLNSIFENNTICRANFFDIYGMIYNYGYLGGHGNIFTKNSGVYEAPNPEYKGSPNIYSIGDLNLTYNVFMDNVPFKGIYTDVYVDGGKIISLDNNWWSTNDNPYTKNKINVNEKINSWFVLDLLPEYSQLNISDSTVIVASWRLSSDLTPKINLLPVLNVTFTTWVDGNLINFTKMLSDGRADFIFNYSQVKGSYKVVATIVDFNTTVLVDVGKSNSYIRFNVTDNITFTDNILLNVEVTDIGGNPLLGNVTVFIGKNNYTIILHDGKGLLNLSQVSPNKYDLKLTYEGNDNYFKSFANGTITINKAATDLSVFFPDIKVDQKGTVTVTLGPKGVQGQAYLYINGVRKKVLYLYNGNTTAYISNFAEGEYNVTVEFWGTEYYEAATAKTTFRVTKYETSLNLDVNDIKVGETQTIRITVSPSNLRGEAILNINGVNTTIFLDNDVTNVTISNLAAGSYDVYVFFPENSKYYSSKASSSFRVLKTLTKLSVDIIENDLDGKITVKTNYTECTGLAGVYVNFRLYTANLTNGVATFNVKFDKGTNYIYVFYDGNAEFEESSWNTTIGVAEEFILIGQNVTAYQYNNFNYTIRLIEYNGIPMPNRIVNILFEGKSYNVTTNNNGIANFLLNLNTGVYQISASYKNQTVSNTLTVKKIVFNESIAGLVYGDNTTLEVEFEKNVTGKVNLFIENVLNVTVDIIDSKVKYNISNLEVGGYELKIKYVNDYFVSDELKTTFEIEKANPIIKLDAKDIVYGDNGTLKVILPEDASGNVLIIVDKDSQSKELINGFTQIDLINMQKGLHNVTVVYGGDSNYNNVSANATFSVKDSYTDVILIINNARYGENITVTAILNETATGKIVFSVDKLSETVEIKEGVANWTFSGLDVGIHSINADYQGDKIFISSYNSTSFEVSKANSTIELMVDSVYLNENILIYAILSQNATGKVLFSIPNYYSPRYKSISNSVAVWYISPLNTGSYTILASYDGDNNYYGSNTSYILNITQRRSILEVSIEDAGINDRVTAKIKLFSSDGESIEGIVKLTVGNKTYDVPVFEGSATFIVGKIAPGNYTYKAVYEGTEEFSKSSISGSFKVVDDLLNLTIIADDVNYYYGANKNYVITVKDDNKKPLSDLELVVKLGGVTYTKTTDSEGKVYIPIKLSIGTYKAEITFNENLRYKGCSLTTTIKILTTLEGIDVTSLYGTAAQYFAIFSDTEGKALGNTEVTFTISGKSYTLKTLPNGVSRINLNFSPGSYKISTVNPASGQKMTNTIFIFQKIMGNKDVTKYFGSSTVYKVRAYSDNGKPVGKGKVVTFKVNGKTYKVKTDKNGYAKCKLNLKPKNYKITATFNGFKVSNNVIVKPVLTVKSVAKKGRTMKIKAKLVTVKGKASKNKKITFKFKGKTYKAKTNKKGIATLKIKVKLKPGKYKLKVKYGKSVVNKIIKAV